MALNPLFTVTFDVSSSDNYGDFIAGIRNRVANPRHFSRNRPVLPPVEPGVPPRRWFHVVLRTSRTTALTLATRADNLYLEGFRSSDGTWWELTRGIIGAGATYVSFGGSYRDLLGDTDKLVGVTLGPQQMTQAVNTLAARTPADLANGAAQQLAKKSVTALLLMVHEAVRFLTVAEHVASFMHPKATKKSETGTITADMKEQVNGWQNLSEALLKMDALLPKPKPEPSKNKKNAKKTEEEVKKAEEEAKKAEEAAKKLAKKADTAAKVLGILLFVEVVPGGMTKATALQLFRGN